MPNQLLGNLFIYKKTAALIAAFQLGLFREIKKHGYMNNELCRQLKWNERYIELLCIYLTSEKYLFKTDNGWKITKEFEKETNAFEKICEHENSLYHKWLSPEQLALSIQALTNNRVFDKEGFTPEEQSAYNKIMYGDNVNLMAFYLLRKIKRDKISPVRCLEYGRSDGRLGQVLKKHIPEMNVDVALLDIIIEEQSLYDVILIYNTVHYKTPEDWKMTFCQMKNALKENGIVCIADVFYKECNVFQSTILLDWITHGGVYNIYSYEVVEQLQSIGFTKIEQQSIDPISTDLLFAYK